MATITILPAKPSPASTKDAQDTQGASRLALASRMTRKRDERLRGPFTRVVRRVRWLSWALLALALAASLTFAQQALLYPQLRPHTPNWYGAHWIAAADTGAPGLDSDIAYFRKDFTLNTLPDSAFLTMQVSQIASIYVNGVRIDTTSDDYTAGLTNLAYMYDATPFLHTGLNVIGLRVGNTDNGAPIARVVFGMYFGQRLITITTDTTWVATSNSLLTQVFHEPVDGAFWSQISFSDSAWRPANIFTGTAPADGYLRYNSAVFEKPMPTSWLVAGAAPDAFFYGAPILPAGTQTWLRMASTGQATLTINGAQLTTQPARFTLDGNGNGLPSRALITAGIYDVSQYVHQGTNSIAVHVAAAGLNLLNNTPQSQPAALSLDLLVIGANGAVTQISANHLWLASPTAAPNWTTGGATNWAPATLAPYTVFSNEQPYMVFPSGAINPPPASVASVALWTLLALLVVCALGVVVLCLRQWSAAAIASAIDRVALSCVPPLLLMAILWAYTFSPMLDPSPFTTFWLIALACVWLATLDVVILLQRFPRVERAVGMPFAFARDRVVRVWRGTTTTLRESVEAEQLRRFARAQGRQHPRWARLAERLRAWAATWTTASIFTTLVMITLMAFGAWMVFYQLGYESYWQDEMASIYAARGILAHGYPSFPSGFVYPKAELYHYLLAGVIALFGDGPLATRSISAVEYVISLPLVYFIGKRLLGRRVGLLATALMVFSPMALHWGRETRMYQQAELFALIAAYFFFQATLPNAKPRTIYLAMGAVLLMYFSHEETFIILPSLVIYFLATQKLNWIRNKHWWIAGGGAILIVLTQLAIVSLSHPPTIGTDSTLQPMVGVQATNINYYVIVLFNASYYGGQYTRDQFLVMAIFALFATLIGLFARDRALRYLSLYSFGSLLTLGFFFYLLADRYIYVVLPELMMLAAAGIIYALDALGRLARLRLAPASARGLIASGAALMLAFVLLAQIPGPANFGLAVSRTLGQPFQHVYPDYAQAGAYIRAHWQPGDIVVSLAPQTDVGFYAGGPDFVLYQDKALSIMELNGHIADVYTGSTYIISTQDFNEMLAKYHRIWLYTYSGYTCCGKAAQFPYQQYFALMWEGNSVAVYLRIS